MKLLRASLLACVILVVQVVSAVPASAALPWRCDDFRVEDGVTARACISADLQRVHGQTRLLLNSAAAIRYAGQVVNVSADIRVFKNNVFEQDTDGSGCSIQVNPYTLAYSCPSPDAINADRRQYQELGAVFFPQFGRSIVFNGNAIDP